MSKCLSYQYWVGTDKSPVPLAHIPVDGGVMAHTVENHTVENHTVGNYTTESSDSAVIDLLRRSDCLRISELASAMSVTATAVRQRLNRLMAQGLVDREQRRGDRGRPWHVYLLTEAGRRQTGNNFTDLAMVLWHEIRSIRDPEIRRGLLGRLSGRFTELYRNQVTGSTIEQRMKSLAQLFSSRDVPMEVSEDGQLPVLTAVACPYGDLPEQDGSICALESMLFSEVLGQKLRLSQCRLDGENCCKFELN